MKDLMELREIQHWLVRYTSVLRIVISGAIQNFKRRLIVFPSRARLRHAYFIFLLFFFFYARS